MLFIIHSLLLFIYFWGIFLNLCSFVPAPPSYAEIVTEEQRQNLLSSNICDNFELALQGPLFAYIQEFRYLPPPLYSEVSIFFWEAINVFILLLYMPLILLFWGCESFVCHVPAAH